MTPYTSPALKELSERGFLYQCTDFSALDQTLLNNKITLYCGYDLTAESLHVGNLVTLMAMRVMQRHGHTPIALLGGATTKVGDPTGKDKQRQLLDTAVIEQNRVNIKSCFEQFLNFTNANAAVVVNNAEWWQDVNYLDFLRDYGVHFSVNRMLSQESVKQRLERESSMTFLEFNYMLLQGYDFYHLHKTKECVLQIGGSDQWGNIITGYDLTRRLSSKTVYGLTFPLITTASGEKMGKSLGKGSIWLNESKLSNYDYWQFWRNVDDADVQRLMKLFTDLPVAEIEGFSANSSGAYNALKERLADAATAMARGEGVLEKIHKSVAQAFGNASALPEQTGTDEKGRPLFATEVPVVYVSETQSDATLVDVIVQSNFAATKSEARRLIKGGAVKLNEIKMAEDQPLKNHFNTKEGLVKLSVGKKRNAYICFYNKNEVAL